MVTSSPYAASSSVDQLQGVKVQTWIRHRRSKKEGFEQTHVPPQSLMIVLLLEEIYKRCDQVHSKVRSSQVQLKDYDYSPAETKFAFENGVLQEIVSARVRAVDGIVGTWRNRSFSKES